MSASSVILADSQVVGEDVPGNRHNVFQAARQQQERLSLVYPVRQWTAVLAGAAGGMMLGLPHGTRTAALRFRAENSHRLPTTHKGWYLYHKSKNYYAMWGGLKEGARMALKVGFWAGAFISIEESVDNLRRGTKDAFSTVVAGLTIAGAFSAWNRFPLTTAAKTAKTGLLFGIIYGISQDALRLARGHSVGYIDFVRRNTKWVSGGNKDSSG